MFGTFVYIHLFVLYVFSGKMSVRVPHSFLIGFFFFFFATDVDELLLCCGYQPFIRWMFFFSSAGCLFVWLIVSDMQKLPSWVQSPFFIFALVACVVQNNFANITSRSFHLCVPLGVLLFPISCLSLNSNLELIHEWCEVRFPSVLMHVVMQLSQHCLSKRLSFPH